ncbi:unnamed protein product [Ixodes hexagonus]
MPLDKLANLADRVAEYSAPTISATSRRSHQDASPPSRPTDNNLETRLSRLEQAIQDLRLSSHPRGTSRRRSRSRQSSPAAVSSNASFCWYHQTFGPEARKCLQPCTWQGN